VSETHLFVVVEHLVQLLVVTGVSSHGEPLVNQAALNEDELSMDSLAVHSQVLKMKTMLDRCSSTSDISNSHVVDDHSLVLMNGGVGAAARSKAVTPLTVDTRLALAAAAGGSGTAGKSIVNGDGDGPGLSQPPSCSSTSPPTPNSDIRVCHPHLFALFSCTSVLI